MKNKKFLPERELLESDFVRNICVIKCCDSIKGCKTVWVKPKEQISAAQEPQGVGASNFVHTSLTLSSCLCGKLHSHICLVHNNSLLSSGWNGNLGVPVGSCCSSRAWVRNAGELFHGIPQHTALHHFVLAAAVPRGNNVNDCNAMADNDLWCGFDW